MYNQPVMEEEFMEWTPLSWNEVSFWWNSSTKNFEVYSNLSAATPQNLPFNYRMYRVAGVWVLEQVKFGEATPHLIISEIPIFRGMSLLHCLSMCCYMWKHQVDLKGIFSDPSRVQELEVIWDTLESYAQNPPEWLGSIESEFSS